MRENMITINKNADNNFRVEYINDEGIANGWASAVFNTEELNTLIALSNIYFDDLYADTSKLCCMALGTATKAMLKRNIDNFGGTEFDCVDKNAVSRAIYSNLTSRVIKEFKTEVA
jgi:hypothetical protein